jgi:hypothetical protein
MLATQDVCTGPQARVDTYRERIQKFFFTIESAIG